MSEYNFEPVENSDSEKWDRLVSASPQGTIFSRSLYLESTLNKYERYFICKGSEIKAGLCYHVNEEDRAVVCDLNTIYSGLLLLKDPNQRRSKTVSNEFTITESCVKFLSERFKSISLPCSPQLIDARPFLWHNYHGADPREKFQVDLRFTSHLNIADLVRFTPENEESSEVFKHLEVLRQRNIREGRKTGARVKRETTPEFIGKFLYFYEELMKIQGSPASKSNLQAMENIIKCALDNGYGRLYCAYDPTDQEASYITIFIFDEKQSYYLFGAGAPNSRGRYLGTFCFWEAFNDLAREGHSTVDLEGINSPKRGAFKLGFGGNIVPYYQFDLPGIR